MLQVPDGLPDWDVQQSLSWSLPRARGAGRERGWGVADIGAPHLNVIRLNSASNKRWRNAFSSLPALFFCKLPFC